MFAQFAAAAANYCTTFTTDRATSRSRRLFSLHIQGSGDLHLPDEIIYEVHLEKKKEKQQSSFARDAQSLFYLDVCFSSSEEEKKKKKKMKTAES